MSWLRRGACLFLFLFLIFPSAYASKITVAVLDFDGKNVKSESAEAVTELLRTELFSTGRFSVVERQKIKSVLDEQKLQMSGVTDSEQAVEIGKLLNVQAILLGSVSKFGMTYLVNTRLVNVRSGLVVLAESKECRGGESKLPDTISELADAIAEQIGLEGAIIHIDLQQVLIDLDHSDGIDVGAQFTVIRPGDIVVDLEGRVIGTRDEVIGTLEVVRIANGYSEASIMEHSKDFRRGDKLKPSTTKISTVKNIDEKRQEDKKESVKPDVPVIF